MIFSEGIRQDASPKRYCESSFAHLNRRARRDYDRIRELIECWTSHLPSTAYADFRSRFCSGCDESFHSAFLELLTHELLIVNYHSVEPHPNLTRTTKRPDFLAVHSNQNPTVVECTVVTEVPTTDRKGEARLGTLYDKLNEVRTRDFFLDIDIIGKPRSNVPSAGWKDKVQEWVDSLDYNEVVSVAQVGSLGVLPKIEFRHDGLKLTVQPIPKRQSARTRLSSRAIGLMSPEASWVISRYKITDQLKKKAGRYGSLKQPYVLVVNCLGETCDPEEIELAMYGDDGLWPAAKRPSFTRLSAVLCFLHLFPWSVPRASACLFHNPFAAHPYRGPLTRFPQFRRTAAGIEKLHGTYLGEHFGLNASWPKDARP